MLKRVILCLTVCALLFPGVSRADEGMWLPMFVQRLNYQDMQKKGLQLTAEEIYSINNSSLKDAIVMLSGGSCTAEMISGQGLMLTNHHCAFGAIQDNSSVDHDYLTDGFFAMNRKQELPANGMTAGFLIRMEDVTKQVLEGINANTSEDDRAKMIAQKSKDIREAATKDTDYNATVKSFFEGNEYYLFVYETFRDVRLVAAPPSSIGKYGGDTDNWMWPRHTGDFSMLRVYAGPDGKPADYSADNVPLKPRHHLPISMNGVKEGDYAMVMGYPGSTDRYLTSYGVKEAIELTQPATVKIREQRLALMKEDMNASDETRIKYASKYAGVSNYYKYFKGQTRGLKRLKVYDKKKAEEDAFQSWVNADNKRKEMYGEAIDLIANSYKEMGDYSLARTYLNECVFGSEIMLLCYRASSLKRVLSKDDVDPLKLDGAVKALKAQAAKHWKNYNMPTDRKVTAALLRFYGEDLVAKMQPEVMNKQIKGKFKGDYKKWTDYVFAKSVFASEERLNAFLEKPSKKVLDKDPAYQMFASFFNHYLSNIRPTLSGYYTNLDKGNRLYVAGLREMNPNKKYYPNANSSMRLTYGQVLDYYPADAVYYNYFTTLAGVMEKEDPNNDEFVVPQKLKDLYAAKDYGQYGVNGEMPVCFITNNDITGGNSGSPVINGKGQLIGCAFDGNWEAMSGDIAFEQKLQRCIVVDIRYVLFVVDKFAGAGHLVEEMTLVKDPPKKEEASMDAPVDGTTN
ncbi:MAG: S46 family peptidase [Salibacteraceae bacterium]